jgi:hypothetical protein
MKLIFIYPVLYAWQNGKKRGLFISVIPDLQVYTIKTPLIGQFSIKTVFSWSQKPSY